MPLTDIAIRAAKPGPKSIRLFDGGGLYLEVAPAGGKWWRLKYRIGGKEKRISLGTYPEVSLREARERRETARKQIAVGIDPSAARKAGATISGPGGNTFEAVAREWYERQKPTWAASHAVTVIRRLERDVFPFIGACNVADIKAADILPLLRRVEERGAIETAKRIQVVIGQVMRYATQTGRAERDPTLDLRGALPPVRPKHHAAPTDPATLAPILRAMHGYVGTPVVRAALQLAPMLFVRPGELRHMRWAEVDLEDSQWVFTASKTNTPLIVPLATQAMAILRELLPITGQRVWVFPGDRDPARPMSNNAVLAALRRMGINGDEASGHGFRAVARTLLVESLGYPPEAIELQLAHSVRDPLGRAYNRVQWIDKRIEMMQCWADYLDELRVDGRITSNQTPSRSDA